MAEQDPNHDTNVPDTGVTDPQETSLGMSDEDFLNQGMSLLAPEPPTDSAPDAPPQSVETPADAGEAGAAGDETESKEKPPAAPADSTPGDEGDPADPADPADPVTAGPPDKPTDADAGGEGQPTEVDYKAEYDRLLAPFRANGKDMRVNNVDEAIQLMQMGANYNKKMAALKPNLKMLKLLEKHELLDEQKLSFLIDIDKKNPEAIAKLVKDSGVDPLDFNDEQGKEYKPTTRTVDDREVELDTVIDEIKDSPTYNQTLDIVSSQWDGPSKQVVANSPQLLKVINDHVASGVYDVISTEVERERTFGRLSGLSDIEAYRQIGDAIQARGGFDHLFKQEQRPPTPSAQPPATPPSQPDTRRNDQRRAASPPKPSSPSQGKPDFNPLALSDAEFERQFNEQFL